MSRLDKAIIMAIEAHEGQTDKSGEPYILHPLRVMIQMTTEDERIVAVLHDTLEDTGLDPNLITKEFGVSILLAVERLSRKTTERYFEYIRRVKANGLTRKVKLADLKDNMLASRIEKLPEAEQGIVERYKKALTILHEGYERKD